VLEKWYEVWAAGNYPQGNFTEEDVQQIVDNYNPEQYEAPIVIGHPQKDDPAFGWVEALKREGKKLLAKFKQVEPTFQEAVNQGRYRKVSVRLRKTDNGWTLRHVGFLGAAPPQVEGLKPIQFTEEASDVDCEFSLPEVTPLGGDPGHKKDFKEGKPLKTEEQIRAEIRAELEKEFSGTQDENAKLKEALAKERRKNRELEFSSFIEQHKEQLPPAVRTGMVDFMISLAEQEEATVEFAEGKETKKQSLLEYFKDFISKLPKQPVFDEDKGDDEDKARASKEFAGVQVDEDRLELHQKALDFMEKNNCSYEDALVKVSE